VIALVAVLKAGAAYVPLDPQYPAERLAFMTGDADVRALLTTRALRESIGSGGPVILLDDPASFTDGGAPVADRPQPDDLAYMIYTSGSTGQPKGALNAHRGIVNRLLWMLRTASTYRCGSSSGRSSAARRWSWRDRADTARRRTSPVRSSRTA
jgi:non-ribosomal peptide synthetase component F